MVRKVGGSRGNPPCVGLCVSCHWRNARRVAAKDCGVWCMEDTSHVLSLFSLLLYLLFFFCSLSQAVSHKRCRGLLVQMEFPPLLTPPHHPRVFKMRAGRKREQEEGGREEDRFENRSHINTFIFWTLSLASLLLCLWARRGGKWVFC